MDEIEYEENQTVEKVEEVSATFSVTFNYTKSVQELLDDGILTSRKDIEQYIIECIEEDIVRQFEEPFFAKRHTLVEIV